MEINYLRMTNQQLADALGKSEGSVRSRVSHWFPARTAVARMEADWDLPFGCRVTKFVSHISELEFCEKQLAEKGVPYIITSSGRGFAIFRANIGNDETDGREPKHSTWIKCHNHPVYGRALPAD